MTAQRLAAAFTIALAVGACGDTTLADVGATEPVSTISTAATPDSVDEMEPVVDGELDCPAGGTWSVQASLAPDARGTPVPEDEIDSYLAAWTDGFGGDVSHIREGVGTLVIDGSEVVLAAAVEAPAGGWIVVTTVGCPGFELDL